MNDEKPRMYIIKPTKASSISTPFGSVTEKGLAVPGTGDAYAYFLARPQRFKISGTRPAGGPNRPGQKVRATRPGDRAKKNNRPVNVITSQALPQSDEKGPMNAATRDELQAANEALVNAEVLAPLSELMKETKGDLLKLARRLRLDTGFADEAKVTKRVIASDIQLHAAALRNEEPDPKAVQFLEKWAKADDSNDSDEEE